MKYTFLLLIVSVLFFQCKDWEKGGAVPVETFSIEKLLDEVRRLDTTSAILKFKPDTGSLSWNPYLFSEFYPDPLYDLKGNVESVVETELSPQQRGDYKEKSTKEYYFQEGRLVKLIDNDPSDSLIQTLQYNADGLLTENKKVFPGEGDSITLEFQYDNEKKLSKILRFDGLNILVETIYFFYHKSGTLDSLYYDDTEGASFGCKVFTSSAAKSFLQVFINDKGRIQSANYHSVESYDHPTYEEQYIKEQGTTLIVNRYNYNENGELKRMEVTMHPGREKSELTQSFRKRDPAGNWIEKLSYHDGDLYGITRRKITYKQPAP